MKDRTPRAITEELLARAEHAFRDDATRMPAMTLRGADSIDSYDLPEPYDPAIDEPTDEYLEAYAFWGHIYLDAASWRHYLPRLISFALRRFANDATMVTESLLFTLRPPDSVPPRLSTLSAEQEEVVVAVLELLAFDERSDCSSLALQVMEEYWIPGALYRPRAEADR